MTEVSTPITYADLPDRATWPQRLKALHFFLAEHAFYPLLLCTMLAMSFLIARTMIIGRFEYQFLVWNLFLAWIPYACSLLAIRLRQWRRPRPLMATFIWCVWLAMLPNAPYILTDFIHLWQIAWLTWWYDLGMMITFALAGCFLGIVSLRIMHDLARPRIGAVAGWIFVALITILCGFGIYLGRFGRWNSWDLLTRPDDILMQIFSGIGNPFAHPRPLGVTLMFGAMMLVTYIMFVSTSRRSSQANA